MALVVCKECKAQISTTAKVCPQCGARPPKKTSRFTWIVIALVVLGVVGQRVTECSSDRDRAVQAIEPLVRCREHAADVIRDAEAAALGKNYPHGLAILTACDSLNDPGLLAAKNRIAESQALAQLETTPPESIGTRKELYSTLATLVPAN